MISYHDQRRLTQAEVAASRDASLNRVAPDVFLKSPVLYVGAHPGRLDYLHRFRNPTILEIFPSNVVHLKELGLDVIEGDVRRFQPDRRFSATFWWHGPEHIPVEDLATTIHLIESYTEDLIVLGCPWGHYPQGEVYGNQAETHVHDIQPETLSRLGFDCDVVGVEGIWSNITATKRLRPVETRFW